MTDLIGQRVRLRRPLRYRHETRRHKRLEVNGYYPAGFPFVIRGVFGGLLDLEDSTRSKHNTGESVIAPGRVLLHVPVAAVERAGG